MKPIRIQRKRTKGWKKPLNTVNCTRSGKGNGVLGNPFFITGDILAFNCPYNGKPYIYLATLSLCFEGELTDEDKHGVLVDCFHRWIDKDRSIAGSWVSKLPDIPEAQPYTKEFIKTFAGQNMMCFCGLDKPCHVDVLLKIANE